MKMKEILEKQADQLSEELVAKRRHLFDLRSQAVTQKLEDPTQIAKTRKDIARIMTVIRQRATQSASQKNSAALESAAPASR